MKYLFFITIVLFCTDLDGQCGEKNKNYLVNAQFAQEDQHWEHNGSDYQVEYMAAGLDDENGYLSIFGPRTILSQVISIPPRARSVCIGALVKNTISSPKSGWAVLDYQILDARGEILKGQRLPHLKPGTHWQKLRKTENLPAAAAAIKLILKAKIRADVEMSNTARFDDVFVRFDA